MTQRCKACKMLFNPKHAQVCVPGTIYCPFCDEEISDESFNKNKEEK